MESQQVSTIRNNLYLSRYAYGDQLIAKAPHPLLSLILTIPCYNEPDLIRSLQSIRQCTTDGVYTEVIVVINESSTAPGHITRQNRYTYEEAVSWASAHSDEYLKFYIVYENNLPKKHAGVGLARKIAMDEAVRRFERINKHQGVIICFDADSTCDRNYLQEVHRFFERHPKAPGCSIYFEHPLEGDDKQEVYEAITAYELFLRYYVNALRYAGFPYAYETIGSSMAVRSRAYQKQGGMNRRKAGEDFYFLHKIIPLGEFGEINNTRVIPSPRRSDRVPFGTGKAVNDWLINKQLLTYSPATFDDLRGFLNNVNTLHNIAPTAIPSFLKKQPVAIRDFLLSNNFENHITRINDNSASLQTFLKQFFQWFDGFKVLKYVHHARDNNYPNIPVDEAAGKLLEKMKLYASGNSRSLLEVYRRSDREKE